MEIKEAKNTLNEYLEEIENYWRLLWHRTKKIRLTFSSKRNRVTRFLE